MGTTGDASPSPGHHLRAEARRRLWPHLVKFLVLLLALLLTMWWQFGKGTYLVVVLLLLVGMSAVHLYVVVRDLRATWMVGADAEDLVGQRLGVLKRRGWFARHGLQKPGGGDIDHIAWGPRGVFVIETKAHKGKVGIESGALTFDGVMPDRDPVDQAFRNALFVKDRLTEELGRPVWVVSVVCLTRAFLDGYRLDIQKPKVHVVKVERLIEFLATYDDTQPLSPVNVREVGDAIRQLGTTGARPPSAPLRRTGGPVTNQCSKYMTFCWFCVILHG